MRESILISNNSYSLAFGILISVAEYTFVKVLFPNENLQIIRLTQTFALTAFTFLYLAVIQKSLVFNFKNNPLVAFQSKYSFTFLVSASYFGMLHASFAFFGQLGGFEGLSFLSDKFILAIVLSFTALCVLFLLSMQLFVERIKKIKYVNNLLYVVGILILIHALMLGTHLQTLSDTIPQIFFTALSFLFLLEIFRVDFFLKNRYQSYLRVSIFSIPLFALLSVAIVYFFTSKSDSSGSSFGIHSQHIQMAKDAQSGSTQVTVNNSQMNSAFTGDRTKRYTVNFLPVDNIQANEDTRFTFKVFDASSGNQVKLFKKINGKVVHMIVVDKTLSYFEHIHPDYSEGLFTITTKFPKDGAYHIYLDFQPIGAIEQQIATTINAGDISETIDSDSIPDSNMSKIFGSYEVTIDYPKPLKSQEISTGQQLLSFNIKNAANKKPINTLKPYLEAFGHLVMINTKTFEYIHVHPNDPNIPTPNQNGGPSVVFMPLGLHGPIKPGVYRIFGQFNPDNNLFTSDFTVEIE